MKMCKEVEDIFYDAVECFFKRESFHFPVHFPPMLVYSAGWFGPKPFQGVQSGFILILTTALLNFMCLNYIMLGKDNSISDFCTYFPQDSVSELDGSASPVGWNIYSTLII